MLDSKSDGGVPVAAAAVVAGPPLACAIKYEAIPALLFLDMQQEDEEKVAAAVQKLALLLYESPANCAYSLCAIAVVLLLMRKWPCNRSIQFHGCCVFAQLDPEKEFSFRMQGSCVYHLLSSPTVISNKSGAIETIMAAMKSFADDEFQVKGLTAIRSLFSSRDDHINSSMAHFVHKLNGIELVVTVMKKFENHASLQESGCLLLRRLSEKGELRDALKKGGALSAVAAAAEKSDGNSVQDIAAKTFFSNMFC